MYSLPFSTRRTASARREVGHADRRAIRPSRPGHRAATALAFSFALLATSIVPAQAVETGALDSSQPGTVIRTPSGQTLSLENVSTPLPGITPLVGNQIPGAPSSTANRSAQYTPAMTSNTSFIDVLSSGDVTNRVDYAALGLPINPQTPTAGIARVLSFDVVLGTPMANPRFQVSVNGPKAATVIDAVTYIIASFGPEVSFSDARDSSGNPVAIGGVTRVSGFQDAQPAASGNGWLANSFLWSTTANTGFLTSSIPWLTASDPDDVALDGTLQLQTGGQPVSRVTVTLDSRFFRDATQGGTDGHLPNISIAVVVPTQVSALPRLLPGTNYGHATHNMPVIGTDNLHLGASIVESQPNTITTELNSGTPTDNSDAGYDGLTSFYLCDDPGQTPVTSIGPGQAGQTLCTTVAVSGARSQRAYVAGYIDFTRAGDFDDPASSATESSPPLTTGSGNATLQWTIPDDVAPGDLPIRLRTSYDPAGVASSGPATTGEVEDYINRLVGEDRSALTLTKANDLPADATVTVGDTFNYTLTLTNNDAVPQTGVLVSDDLPAGLEYVTAGADPRWTFGSATSASAVVDVPANSTATLPLTVQVTAGAAGVLRNIAVVDDQDPTTCLATPTNLCGVDAAAPTATAAPTLTGTPTAGVVGDAYSFTFTVDGDPAPSVTVTAGALPGGLSLDPSTGAVTGTPTAPGTFAFTVTAANGTAPDAVLATSITITQAPTVAGTPPSGVVGNAYSFTFTLTGDPAPTVTVTDGVLPSGLSLDENTGAVTGTPSSPGVFAFTLTATNGTEPDAVLATSITVTQAPTITGVPVAGSVGNPYSFTFTLGGSPAPAVAVTSGALPDGLSLDENTGAITGTPTATGLFEFTVTASNGTAPDAVLDASIAVTQAPTISGTPTAGAVGNAYGFTFTLGGTPLPTVAVTAGSLPDGLALNEATGAVTGTPTAAGTFAFTVTATNGTAPDAVLETSIVVTQAPTITGTPPDGVVGTAYNFAPTLAGSPAPTVALTDGALPDGLTLDEATGAISGTPTAAGMFTFTLTAANGTAPDAVLDTSITITQAPTITGTPPAGVVGSAYGFTFTLDGSPVPTATVTDGNLPDGLTLNEATGAITGTPTVAGVFAFTVTATNGTAPDAVIDSSITVTAAPTISGTPSAGVVGEVYSFAFALGGSPAPTLSVTGGALPDGLSLDEATGAITGTPTTAGLFAFTVTASNGTAPDAVLDTLIEITQAPTITGTPPAGVVGNAYNFTFTLGGSPEPTVAVTAGTLPDGLTLDADSGAVTGMPTVAGVFTFTVTASNGTAPDAVLATSITVDQAPTIAGTPPDGVVGNAYNFTFTLSGSPDPTVAVTIGDLPDGLTLGTSGAITGTPTAAGTFAFTVTASNGTAPDAVLNTSITVTQAPTITGVPLAGVVGTGYSFAFTLDGDPTPTVAVTDGALPAGLSLDSATGTISGTPSAAGTFAFTVTASNGTAPDAVLATSITIVQAPSIVGSPPVGSVGNAYSFTFTLGGSPTPTVAVTDGALPDGLSLNGSTGAITGTPTAQGLFPFTLTATNGTAPDAVLATSITVRQAPTIIGPLPSGIVGTTYSFTFTLGGDPAPTVILSGGNLPDGLSLNEATGEITGTPTAAGSFPFTVTASNGTPPDAVLETSITINEAPAIAGTPPSGTVGDGYAYAFALSGSPSPTVAVTDGGLPDGLVLDPNTGRITGTPTAAGVFPFTLTATNGIDPDAVLNTTITISVAPVLLLTVDHPERAPGQTQVATGRGFVPGEDVAFVLNSDPVDLGTVVADATGTVVLSFTVPTDTVPGTHTVSASGQRGTARTTFAVVVSPTGPGTTTEPGEGGGSGQTGGLVSTGARIGIWITLAIASATIGATLLLVIRRRPSWNRH